jgi:hypothetical protein
MARKIKILSLALVAIGVMGAVAASALAVKEFRSATKHVVVKGSSVVENQFHVGGFAVKCGKAEFAGTYPIGAISTPELTLEASYENCSSFKGTPVTIKMNNCRWLLTLEEGTIDTGGGNTHTEGITHLLCEGTSKVEMIVGALCTIHVAAQTPKGVMDSKLESSGAGADIQTTSTITGIAYQRTGSLACGPATGEAEYTGSFTLQGFETNGTQVGIWIA